LSIVHRLLAFGFSFWPARFIHEAKPRPPRSKPKSPLTKDEQQSAKYMNNYPISSQLFARAQQVIPGGVNSPVRAFRGVGGTPLFIKSAQGCFLSDADGREYIDYVGSWGPMILGHAHPEIIAAIQSAATRGTSFGAPTELEIELAEEVIQAIPSIEKLRLTSSGTEATMSALRVARGFTGRAKIVKFEGCYHGHGDSLLVKAGSGVATLGLPDSPGVLPEVAQNTITVPFNDVAALEAVFEQVGSEIAAVIIEPVVGNMGCVPPQAGYLQSLRDLTAKHGAVLIFDEVMTGFRVARGGAQALYNIKPDMTCLGKIIGGGLPVGAFGGKHEIMDCVAPVGPVYQAGTLSGNPLAVTAGLTQLRLLRNPAVYEHLERVTKKLVDGFAAAAAEAGVSTFSNRVGSMCTAFFTAAPVVDWTTAASSDRAAFGRFFHAMLEEGVYLAPSQFEAAFVSYAHSDEIIERTIDAARKAFAKV
jgi:glutamate-1-semialdehyde 2,1-aminomutase